MKSKTKLNSMPKMMGPFRPGDEIIQCRNCGNQKKLANVRIKVTKLCYKCSKDLIPSHIPKEQWIQYILRYYDEM